MNEDVLKGKWKEIKGGVKAKWGKLTDDDLTQVEGNKEQLLGLLQQKYGYAKDKAEQEYKDFIVRYKGKSRASAYYYLESRGLICARPVDAVRARPAVRRSRTGYASAAASHPKSALARRNRGSPLRL